MFYLTRIHNSSMQNPWQYLKEQIAERLGVKAENIEEPNEHGDFAFPCFEIAKLRGENPNSIANEMIKGFSHNLISQVNVIGPYINFNVDWSKFASKFLNDINEKYGTSVEGNGETVVVEYSSPNIAKPMSIGHLRSTIIGQALRNMHVALGYKVVGINYLGDWGTQFGKLIVAYKRWGSNEKLRKEPIKEMLNLYVKFHEEVERLPELDEEARKIFNLLEKGDKELLSIWSKFREISIQEFKKVYKLMGIEFDVYSGESFYRKEVLQIIDEAILRGFARREPTGAVMINLSNYNLPNLMIQKSDGSTLYSTRDLVAMQDRFKCYRYTKSIYVVGSEQNLHFQQLFASAQLMGYPYKGCVHVDFGLVSLKEGRMSTRLGRVVFLEDVFDKSIKLARKIVEEKNSKLPAKLKEKISKQVGIGAIFYNDLMNDRTRNIVFDWDRMLRLEGKTAPYIQYTHARACSILKKVRNPKGRLEFTDPHEFKIIKLLAEYPDIIQHVARELKPHYLANYLYDLADAFNTFYQNIPVLKAPPRNRNARIQLVKNVKTVLKNGLMLLNIEVPEKM